MRILAAALALPALLAITAPAAPADVINVPADFPTIHAAVAASNAGDEIIVAPGTYSRTGFPIISSVESGGHALTIRSSGGPEVTILDGLGLSRIAEIFLGETPDDVLIEGFTFRNGFINNNYGGAVFFYGGAATVRNCVFEDNDAFYGGAISNYEQAGSGVWIDCVFRNNEGALGGAAFNFDCKARFENCLFEDNLATDDVISTEGGAVTERATQSVYVGCTFRSNTCKNGGGAMQTGYVGGDLTLIGCTFEDNTSLLGSGGGVMNRTSGVLTAINCRFLGNTSSTWGGGIFSTFCESLTVVNCEFSGNRAGTFDGSGRSGGGIYSQSHTGPVRVINSTFSQNRASSIVGGGFASSSDPDVTVANSIFWGNLGAFGYEGFEPTSDENDQAQFTSTMTLDARRCIIMNFASTPGTDHSGADPLLVDADGADDLPGTPDDDLRLGAGSPAIDAGDNALVPADGFDLDGDMDTSEPIPFDVAGEQRLTDDPATPDTGAGTAPIVDIGAHEAGAGESPCVGDIDGDGLINFADLNTLLGVFNEVGEGLPGDFDGDDDVDFADLNALLGEFNTECP